MIQLLRPCGGLRQDSSMTKWLKLLSLFNGLILMMQLYQKLSKTLMASNKIQEDIATLSSTNTCNNTMETKGKKCPLCLEPRIHPTSTLCGHVFCWTCIQESALVKPECPICRDHVIPSKLIPLMNID